MDAERGDPRRSHRPGGHRGGHPTGHTVLAAVGVFISILFYATGVILIPAMSLRRARSITVRLLGYTPALDRLFSAWTTIECRRPRKTRWPLTIERIRFG